jgi:hypothetical protein
MWMPVINVQAAKFPGVCGDVGLKRSVRLSWQCSGEEFAAIMKIH